MGAKEDREDEVIDLLVQFLRDAVGTCELVGNPDRDAWTNGLTVDAVLQLSPTEPQIAVDVTTLSLDPIRVGAAGAVRQELEQGLRPILQRLAMKTTVLCDVPTGGATRTRAFVSDVVSRVERACALGDRDVHGPGATHAILQPAAPDLADADRVKVLLLTSDSSDLALELRTHAGPPIERKLESQLRVAKELGYRTALAIDRLGPAGLPLGANWLVSAHAVADLVRDLAASHVGVLDETYMVDGVGIARLP